MDGTYPPPPFDAELLPVLRRINETIPATIDLDRMIGSRTAPRPPSVVEQRLAAGTLVCQDHAVPGLDGDPVVKLSVFEQPAHVRGGPAIYFIHGGGMVSGDRTSIDVVLPLIDLLDVLVVSVEYRLAPEHLDPTPVNDCYDGLVWTATHADDLGFDPSRLVIAGVSAGGGLAAGSALLARDKGGPRLAAQVLMCPMIDDRNRTVSSRQIEGIGVWDRTSNATGWSALLGDRHGTNGVSVYAAPARSTDLSRLPPAYIDCGSAEVFRDEAVAYASAIWAAGGVADLNVWAGGFHGFDTLASGASLSAAARDARVQFLRRTLGLTEVQGGRMAPAQGRFGI
jgi:acetyl esterase/lipase